MGSAFGEGVVFPPPERPDPPIVRDINRAMEPPPPTPVKKGRSSGTDWHPADGASGHAGTGAIPGHLPRDGRLTRKHPNTLMRYNG